jgi:hypothetical protein
MESSNESQLRNGNGSNHSESKPLVTSTKNPWKLDSYVDFTKNAAIVGLAAFGAYRALIELNGEYSFIGLFIFGGAIIYALYLPYKVAGVIQGDWGFVARARVVRSIVFGIPLWVLIAVALSWDKTIAERVVLFITEPSSSGFDRPFLLFTLFVIIAHSAVSGLGLDNMLNLAGFDKDEASHLSNYLKSNGLRDTMMVSLIVLYSEVYIELGLTNFESPVVSQGYLNLGFLYFIFLVGYGLFYPIYVPERYPSDKRIGMELLAGAALFFSPIDPVVGIAVSVIFLSALLIRMKQNPTISVAQIQTQAEQEAQQRKGTWWAQRIESYFINHKRASKIIIRTIALAYISAAVLWGLGFDTMLIIIGSIVLLILFFIMALFRE